MIEGELLILLINIFNLIDPYRHHEHHKNNKIYYGIDILDIVFDTKYILEDVENFNNGTINIII